MTRRPNPPGPPGTPGVARPVRPARTIGGALGLVGLLLLTAGLLVMHGLDPSAHALGAVAVPGAGPDHHTTRAPHVAPDHHTDHRTGHPAQDDGACPDCAGPGHLVAVCVAVLAAVVGIGALRLLRVGRAATGPGLLAARRRITTRWERPPRAPDPAWVRLAVMRC